MKELRRTLIRRSLHRPQLIWGGERELMLTTVLLAGTTIGMGAFAGVWWVSGVGAAVWVVMLRVLRAAAKSDAKMSLVYRRQLRFKPYYPARSRPWRVSSSPTIY